MSDNNYALVKDGFVANTVIWDGEGEMFAEYQTIILTDGITAGPGWTYDGKNFHPPKEPEKSHDEMVEDTEQQKESLLNEATSEVVVWQTKLLVGRTLTDLEKAQLNAWLDYIDELNVVDPTQVPDINWPVPPAE
ncbi:tail fiber assembly protein [Rahnella inusitata]|uniref:tail fiber assembly protein n=1 Tax=Rahnella inusitata TaxID=58169 RepID=UPI0039B08BDB